MILFLSEVISDKNIWSRKTRIFYKSLQIKFIWISYDTNLSKYLLILGFWDQRLPELTPLSIMRSRIYRFVAFVRFNWCVCRMIKVNDLCLNTFILFDIKYLQKQSVKTNVWICKIIASLEKLKCFSWQLQTSHVFNQNIQLKWKPHRYMLCSGTVLARSRYLETFRILVWLWWRTHIDQSAHLERACQIVLSI